MSREIEKIRHLVNSKVSGAGRTTFYAEVVEVDEDLRTCKVKVGNIERENVLLYAIEDEDKKGFVLIPKAESQVIVSQMPDGSRLFVEMFSEVDKVLLTIGEKMSLTIDEKGALLEADKTTLSVKDSGFVLTRDGSGLLKTLSDLCDAITKLTVPTALGPSGIPINAADFISIKTDLKKYLEG